MNIEHNYIEKGTGFPLILLHGNSESNEYFVAQIDYFAKRYRVIALDTRGHGKTNRGDKDFTLDQFAEDLKQFLVEKKIEKANILGFSDGGNIALLFTLKYQEYVRTLIIDGANIYPAGLKVMARFSIRLGYEFCRKLAPISTRFKKHKEMLRLMTHEPNITPEMLAAITIPVLVMAGSNDIIKREHTEKIYRSLPNAKLKILVGNHFIARKKAKQFNTCVQEFLILSENTNNSR